MSWTSGLQKSPKPLCVAALNKEAVGVVSVRQEDMEGGETLSPKAARQILCRGLTTSVGVGIEGKVDSPRPIAQLLKLPRVRMIA
jgi:hypothetical protein